MAHAPDPLRVIQITDTHFFASDQSRLLGVDTASSFANVWHLAHETFGIPDLYLFTGDLSQDETIDSYKRLSNFVSNTRAPCFRLPGNHDRRAELVTGLANSEVFLADQAFTFGSWRFILLDSLVEGKVGGHLDKTELDRLSDDLAQNNDKHAIIAVHHQVLEMGSAWLDDIGIDNAEQLLAVIDNHKNIKVVVWGHVHQEFDKERLGVRYLACPSTCVQFKPASQKFAVDPIPPGCRLIELNDDGTISTKVLRTNEVACGLEVRSAGY